MFSVPGRIGEMLSPPLDWRSCYRTGATCRGTGRFYGVEHVTRLWLDPMPPRRWSKRPKHGIHKAPPGSHEQAWLVPNRTMVLLEVPIFSQHRIQVLCRHVPSVDWSMPKLTWKHQRKTRAEDPGLPFKVQPRLLSLCPWRRVE